ncbi:LysM peptidoglycan-binding domain-containing protein [Trinickia terrae]|uniref:LysM peptidoglycan-binding domain-containing protein n=1 Tax=Trinickia terrae TaxID=2571161 RepID=A0A4U1I0Q1_9BURK|nr:FecR domain-containing protein [Trinickia terrae]TKC86703.1 LysM peptidoglycan-binding domain-containing protein [Trinickia terrae]
MAIAAVAASLAVLQARPAEARQPHVPTASAAAAPYVTRPGDTLIGIAGRYLRDPGDWRALARGNRVSEPRHLPAGMTLRLPVALLRRDPLTASVVAMSGPVERAFRGGRYVPATVGATLAEGDCVRTGDNGFVTLELADGSHLSLPSNTELDLTTLRQTALVGTTVRQFALKRGEVDSQVTHATHKDDRFQIRSPSVVAGVRGTRFRVGYDDAQQATAVEVLDGAVGVAAAAANGIGNGGPQRDAYAAGQLVGARYGSVTRASGGVGGPVALLGAPALRNPAKVQDDSQVAFDLDPLAGAGRYRVEIARDAGVLDVVRDAHVDAPHASFADLPDGTYFVRLSAIDTNGLQGLPQTYAFERRLTGLSASAARRPGSHDYEFRWLVSRAGEPGAATRFRFVLAAAPDLQHPLVDRVDLDAGHIVVSDLPAGVYYWTVVAERFENGRFYEKAGAVQSFTLAY